MAAKKKPPIVNTKPKSVYGQQMTPFEGYRMELYTTQDSFNKAYCYYHKIPLEDISKNSLGITGISLPERPPAKEKRVYLVGVFDGRRTTLVHELTHMVVMLFQHHGINIPDSSGEAFCYQLDNVFSNTVRFFRKN